MSACPSWSDRDGTLYPPLEVNSDATGEVFLPVVGYEGLYEVSNYGTVRGVTRNVATRDPRVRGGVRAVTGKTIAPSTTTRGHGRVRFCKDGRQSRFMVHRLVLETHGPGPAPHGFVCRHLDGNPRNNFVGNLAWGTAVENWDDRRRHGRGTEGEKHRNAILTEGDVRQIRAIGGRVEDLAGQYGVSESCVRHVLSGHSWSHLA